MMDKKSTKKPSKFLFAFQHSRMASHLLFSALVTQISRALISKQFLFKNLWLGI